MKNLFLVTVVGALAAFACISYACNEAVCASIVSKCMITQSCKCDLANCSCCKECFSCLNTLYSECCSCVGECRPRCPTNGTRFITPVCFVTINVTYPSRGRNGTFLILEVPVRYILKGSALLGSFARKCTQKSDFRGSGFKHSKKCWFFFCYGSLEIMAAWKFFFYLNGWG